MKILPKDYPANRPWDEKVFTMPNIPRGNIGLPLVLRDILTKVSAHDNPNSILSYDGSDSRITLNEACVRLRPMRLVVKTGNGWEISEQSKCWLESGDTLYLAAVFCANIRFVAEILYYLDAPKKSTELKEIATREYGLEWKTISDVNARLVWLRQLGLVDFQEFSLLYSLTEVGQEFLSNIEVVDPSQISRQDDSTLSEQSLHIESWAVGYCNANQQQLATRKQSIGYIPGNISDFKETIYEYLNLIQSGADYEALITYAKANHTLASSSIKSFMSTLINMGLIKRQTDTRFVLTDIADKWLNNCSPIELICCIHRNFLYVFELLNELNGQALSYKEIAAIGSVSYGVDKASIEEFRKRVHILKSAKLIRNVSLDTFSITKRGQLLLEQFSLQDRKLKSLGRSSTESLLPPQLPSLLTELRLASKDSTNPDRFEWAIKSAFETLGFTANRLGGSGKTDVLVRTPGSPKVSFSVAVDAKSTSAASVSDSLIDFDTLEEHRKKHHADYSLVVGCAFQNERLIKRAIEHKVVLLDVDTFEALIKSHLEVPIKLNSYKAIFEKPGIADIGLVDDQRQELIRFGKLMKGVMSCLIAESEDPVTEGLLLERDIYRSLRDRADFDKVLSMDEISNMLQLLSSPLIGCVEKVKDGYYATGSLPDVARKFDFYSKSCVETKSDE